jgi:hypothetical protein
VGAPGRRAEPRRHDRPNGDLSRGDDSSGDEIYWPNRDEIRDRLSFAVGVRATRVGIE